MNPDLTAIRREFELGTHQDEICSRYGVSKSTLYRYARKRGWVRGGRRFGTGATPPHAPDNIGGLQVNPEDVELAMQEPSVLEETLATLKQHADVAKGAAAVAAGAITRANALLKTATDKNDNSLIHAAAAMLLKATSAFEAANRIYRRNRGLDGVTRIEHSGAVNYTVEETRAAIAREFGFHLPGTAGDPTSLPVDVSDESATS